MVWCDICQLWCNILRLSTFLLQLRHICLEGEIDGYRYPNHLRKRQTVQPQPCRPAAGLEKAKQEVEAMILGKDSNQ